MGHIIWVILYITYVISRVKNIIYTDFTLVLNYHCSIKITRLPLIDLFRCQVWENWIHWVTGIRWPGRRNGPKTNKTRHELKLCYHMNSENDFALSIALLFRPRWVRTLMLSRFYLTFLPNKILERRFFVIFAIFSLN